MSKEETRLFCRQVRARTKEHRLAILSVHGAPSVSISVLRMELDSMIRTVFLLTKAPSERAKLVRDSINGVPWTVPTSKGKRKKVTDREMVSLAQRLDGWAQAVYSFGCAFVHLTNFHDYGARDPIAALSDNEKAVLLRYLRSYHGYHKQSVQIADLIPLIPAVFEKIAGNLDCYLKDLESGKALDLPS